MASISAWGRRRSGVRRRVEFASRNPKSVAVANRPADRNFECIPMWRFGNSRARQENSGFAGTDGQRQFCFLGALGRRRCRRRTPGPPPLSSMNSTPAASKARRKVKSLATRRFSDFRFNYSVLGDTVNIASRLEARTKDPSCHQLGNRQNAKGKIRDDGERLGSR